MQFGVAGSEEYLLAQHGLDPKSIERPVLTTLDGRRKAGAQRTG